MEKTTETYKEYLFDSLLYRFKDYQHRCYKSEVKDLMNTRCMDALTAERLVKEQHERDLMEFIIRLNDAIGECD